MEEGNLITRPSGAQDATKASREQSDVSVGIREVFVPTTGLMGAAAFARRISRQFGWAALVLFLVAPFSTPWGQPLERLAVAAPAFLLALGVRIWARGFHRNEGFVLNGPYRYVRNPVELGAVLAFLGGGIVLGLPLWYVPLVIGVAMAYMSFLAIANDKALVLQIGPSYLRYSQRVGRWWPNWLPGVNRATRNYSLMQAVKFEKESLLWAIGLGIVYGVRTHYLNS